MNTYRLHTLETAPAGSSPVLEAAGKGLGFIVHHRVETTGFSR